MPHAAWIEGLSRFSGEVTLRATVLLVVAAAAGLALRWGAAATRRRLWAGTLVALLLLPVLSAALPRLAVLPPSPLPAVKPSLAGPILDAERSARLAEPFAVASRDLPTVGPRSTAAPAAGAPTPPLAGRHPIFMALAALYLLGLAVAARRLIRARLRALQVFRAAGRTGAPWQVPDGVESRESDAVALPQALGSWRAVLLLPRAGRGWPEAWRAAVLAHEVAHVRVRDPLWQLLGEIACAIYWFHPLAHLALRQLRIERELAADDATLAAGQRPSEYARVLFELACIPEQPAPLGAVVPLLTPGGLKARIRALLDPGRPRRSARGGGVVLAALGVLAVLPLAAAVPERRAPPIDPASRWLIGKVVDSEGRPVAGAQVSFRPDGMSRYFTRPHGRGVTVLSEPDGSVYYPDGFARETTFGVFARKGTLAARKGIHAVAYGTALPTTFDLRPGQALAGTVRGEDGRPVEGATVRIVDDKEVTPGPGPQVLARSDRDGRWRIEGLLYGQFQLLVQAPWGVASTRPAQIQDRDETGLDTVVPAAWPVTGFLRDEHDRPFAGIQVEQARLSLFRRPEIRLFSPVPGERHLDWDETAADGSFRLVRIGEHMRIQARDLDGRELVGELEALGDMRLPARDGAFDLGFAVALQPGSPQRPIVVRMSRPARVTGFVRTSDGAAIGGIVVRATKIARPFAMEAMPAAATEADGRFEIFVPGTDLSLRANRPGRGWAETALRLQPGETRADVVITLPAVTPAP